MSSKMQVLFHRLLILAVFVGVQLYVGQVLAAQQLTKNDITWTFDRDYTTGQFANGDYWVVDPGNGVVIVKIDPPSVSGGTTVNDKSISKKWQLAGI